MKVAIYAKTRDLKFCQIVFFFLVITNVLARLTYKSAPFCSTQVHDITVSDKHHLDHYRFINVTIEQP